jgi:ABC-type transport system substrate-binding protein
MLKLFHTATLTEKILLGLLSLVIVVSTFQIGDAFYLTHSTPVPGSGGTYVEGVVGEFRFLNPVLAQTDLDRDVTSLVSCGLTRFDQVKNEIVDDAADHVLSPDQRTYTFTLRDNVLWHDGIPVTTDDVIFTFREVLQHEDFTNPALVAKFADVLITKIDEQTVTFTLQKDYAFFIYNTNIGLLPKHILKDTPVGDLLASPFNLQPIGCGPYQIDSVTGSQIKLAAFANYFRGKPFVENVIFRIFGSRENLFKNLDSVTGTKDLAPEQVKSLGNDARLALHEFALPQYVALFFNTDHEILKNKKTRLGLQLATNKTSLAEALGNVKIIDTPLLEIDTSDWKYEFSAERADGALFDAGWHYPTAVSTSEPATIETEATSVAEEAPANEAISTDQKFIEQPSSEPAFAVSEAEFFLEGTVPVGTSAVFVNNYQLGKFAAGDSKWSYKANTAISTLQAGENKYIVEATVNGARQELDRATVFYSASAEERTAWETEHAKTMAVKPAEDVVVKDPQPKTVAANRNLRQNEAGTILSLKVLVPAEQENFVKVANTLVAQWRERGVELIPEILPQDEFLKRLSQRDYDAVIFGQNLGYNLDTYAFWHSSEARPGGSNLSNIKSSGINAWLEQIRGSFDSSERRKRLGNLRAVIAEEVPAVFLYTPTYYFAIDQQIKNFNLGRIALMRDRLAGANGWYLRESRELAPDAGVFTFLGWFFSGELW